MAEPGGSAFESAKRGLKDTFTGAMGALIIMLVMVGGMWLLEIVDYLLPGYMDYGIRSWSLSGLTGIVTGPFLHFGFDHLIGNSLPLLVLGFLAAFRGLGKFLAATGIIMLIGGLGPWIFNPPGVNTLGASGLVFGYFGYVLGRGLFDRRVIDMLIAVGVAAVYSWILWGVLPTDERISWQGHLFGLIGGLVGAWLLRRRKTPAALPEPTW